VSKSDTTVSTFLIGGPGIKRSNSDFVAVSTFTKTGTTTDAIDLALKTYAKLWQQGIDTATFDSAKSYVKGQFPARYETSSDIAFLLAEMFVYDFDESFINSFTQQVNKLDVDRSKEVFVHVCVALYLPDSAPLHVRPHYRGTAIKKACE
jgi:predicted Zn-dependent peptidase